MDEIMRFNRDERWPDCLDRVAILRRRLASLQSANGMFDQDDLALIQGAIIQIRDIEAKVEKAHSTGKKPNITRLNDIVVKQIETVHRLQTKLKHHLQADV